MNPRSAPHARHLRKRITALRRHQHDFDPGADAARRYGLRIARRLLDAHLNERNARCGFQFQPKEREE